MAGRPLRVLLQLGLLIVVTEGLSCPKDWVEHPLHNSCLRGQSKRLTWVGARDACAVDNSTLVHIESDEVKTYVDKMMNDAGHLSSKDDYWIAANDILDEGTMRSVFARPLSYARWDVSTRQPNDHEQNGAPHTQNCVMDVLDPDEHKQEDKACAKSSDTVGFVCEMWPQYWTQGLRFTYMDMNQDHFLNYGVSSEADDTATVDDKIQCAAFCLAKYFFCDVFIHSTTSKKCQLLRLLENARSKADIATLEADGYKAFQSHGPSF